MAKVRELPVDLRARLEQARLDALALFRALDRLHLTPNEIPQRLLRELFELDADYAEALWALDQPTGALNFKAMVADTTASLQAFSKVGSRFTAALPSRATAQLQRHKDQVRTTLSVHDAYRQVPGRDPEVR
jgi:D-serine deaminase-like pyridoxal phosphate-dependent protein